MKKHLLTFTFTWSTITSDSLSLTIICLKVVECPRKVEQLRNAEWRRQVLVGKCGKSSGESLVAIFGIHEITAASSKVMSF